MRFWIKSRDSNMIIIQTKAQNMIFLSDREAQLRDS
jgi:hypothetical protein